MHIVHIGTFPYPSPQGSQVYVKGLLKGQAQLGHQVSLLCYGYGVGDLEEETGLGIEVIRIPMIGGYRNMRAGPDWVKPVLDALMVLKLRKVKPDIIHVHNYEAPLVAQLSKLLASHLRGMPMVYSAHTLMEEELPTYYQRSYHRVLARIGGWILDKTVPRMADGCVVLQEGAVPTLTRIGCQNVTVVPPGIDPTEFMDIEVLRSNAIAEMQEGKWVVYAGNPDAYQNIEVLLEAMDCLPEVGLVFVSASNTRFLRRKNGRVLHIQTSDFLHVQRVIAQADLAVIPRKQCTGFPIKLFNYLALSCVTLVAEGSYVALPGAIQVPNGDVQALVRSIAHWLKHEEERKLLGKHARQHLFQQYTHVQQAKKMVEFYQRMQTMEV